MTVLEILKGARELIATPEKWIKGAFGRDTAGAGWHSIFNMMDAKEEVCAVCLTGALYLAADDARADDSPLFDALGFYGLGDAITWNDAPKRTHAEVLARLDAAIATEEAKASAC